MDFPSFEGPSCSIWLAFAFCTKFGLWKRWLVLSISFRQMVLFTLEVGLFTHMFSIFSGLGEDGYQSDKPGLGLIYIAEASATGNNWKYAPSVAC